MVIAPIRADELTAHETNIGLEGKMFGALASHGVSAHASDCCPSDKTIEIGDGAGFDTGSWKEHMEHWPRRTK
jgi:hypothetical protein